MLNERWFSLGSSSRHTVLRRLSVAFGAKRKWLELLPARPRSLVTRSRLGPAPPALCRVIRLPARRLYASRQSTALAVRDRPDCR